ncbi:MAG: hypothetical protein Q7R94_03190 [bacterium]|nr:hypothetical protein [bacterium]
MMNVMKLNSEYLKELGRRSKESHVYKNYQLIGLEIAKALHDEKHKSLYIKMAKEGDAHELLRLAKDVADRTGIANKGAYFMALTKKTIKNAGKDSNN